MITKALSAAGVPPSNQAVALNVGNLGGVAVQVTGTWVGTLAFVASLDGRTFVPLALTPSSGAAAATTATANGAWAGSVGGYGTVAVYFSSYSSGSATVLIEGSEGTGTTAGSSGGGSTAVTMAASAVSAGAYVAGSLVDGALTTLGAEADVAASTDTSTATLISLFKRLLQRVTTMITALGSPFQAGGALGAGTAEIGNVKNSGTFAVQTPLAGPFVSQAKISVTGTRVQLGSNVLSNGVIITALSTNTAKMTVGGSAVTNTVDGTGNGYILEAGSSSSFAVSNTNALYINGTAGDIVSYAGS